MWTEDGDSPGDILSSLSEPPLHHKLATLTRDSITYAAWAGPPRFSEVNPRALAITSKLGASLALNGLVVIGPLTEDEIETCKLAAEDVVVIEEE